MAAEWRAKHLLAAAGALVAGLALGGLGPRSEIRGLHAELAECEDRVCDRDVGREIASVFQGRPWEPAEPGSPPAPDDHAEDPEVPTVEDPALEEAEPAVLPEEGLAAMRDAMELRRAQAMAALEQRGEPTEEQLAEIDRIFADMNAELRDLAVEAVARFRESGGEPERRDLMVFAADTLDVLIGAEDALYEALDPEQREALGDEALDPLSYVDPSIVDVLAELDRP